MSFRARLTTFFVVIVVVPMAAMAILVFRLIDGSQTGKADARASGVAATATSVYENAGLQGSFQARAVAQDLAPVPASGLASHVASLARRLGLVRVTVRGRSGPPIDIGSRTAVAPGVAVLGGSAGRPARTITVSQLTAAQLARELAVPGIQVVVRSGARRPASTLPAAGSSSLPTGRETVKVGSSRYRVQSEVLPGYGHGRVRVWILSNLAYGGSVAAARLLAVVLIVGFLILAFFFSLLSSRALQSQLSRFLDAARRLAGGDFSAAVPTVGHDEFALLGEAFNDMSRQLKRRLDELRQERSRGRESVRRIGEAFASGLDRDALLELALRTAMDATNAGRGRVSVRRRLSEPLSEVAQVGSLAGLETAVREAESAALGPEGVGHAKEAAPAEAAAAAGEQPGPDSRHIAAVALAPIVPGGPRHGLITVCRSRAFSDDDLELLRTLATQTSLAMANINLHHDVQRQAVTDDLTGLATHGHFQQLLSAEMEEVRRYRYPVGLIMLDIDDFKSINDLHGHQQGDVVLREVGDALRASSRDVDIAARYGGEEMALILPHTDLPGAYEMAERVRMAIEELEIPLVDGRGTLRITASAGAASSADGSKDELIAAADGALYAAKRQGKNRTVKAALRPADVVIGE